MLLSCFAEKSARKVVMLVHSFVLPEDLEVEYGRVVPCIECPAEHVSCGGPDFSLREVVPDAGGASVFGVRVSDGRLTVCRARTVDGVHFTDTRDLFELPEPDNKWLARDIAVTDKGECILLMCDMGRPPTSGHRFHVFSGGEDGTGWKKRNADPVYLGQDSFCTLWSGGRIINYQTTYQKYSKRFPDNMGAGIRRVLHIRTSPDGLEWSPGGSFAVDGPWLPEDQLIVPDEGDPEETEFYKFSAFEFRSFYVGIMVKYISQPECVGLLPGWPHGPLYCAEWWLSRDGFTWLRPYNRNDCRLNALPHDFLYNLRTPLDAGEMLRWPLQSAIIDISGNRFLGVECRANASVLSPPLNMKGVAPRLHVSFNSVSGTRQAAFRQGYVMVEVTDCDGNVIEGFERSKCMFSAGPDNVLNLAWRGSDTGALPADRKVRLRIMFRDARIYTLECPEV